MSRLSALKAKFVLPPNWSAQADPVYIGVTWECRCPKCTAEACPTCGHKDHPKRLSAMFWPPIDPNSALTKYNIDAETCRMAWGGASMHQRVSGETIDTLTLSPSVGHDPHWHGHITSGEATP